MERLTSKNWGTTSISVGCLWSLWLITQISTSSSIIGSVILRWKGRNKKEPNRARILLLEFLTIIIHHPAASTSNHYSLLSLCLIPCLCVMSQRRLNRKRRRIMKCKSQMSIKLDELQFVVFCRIDLSLFISLSIVSRLEIEINLVVVATNKHVETIRKSFASFSTFRLNSMRISSRLLCDHVERESETRSCAAACWFKCFGD